MFDLESNILQCAQNPQAVFMPRCALVMHCVTLFYQSTARDQTFYAIYFLLELPLRELILNTVKPLTGTTTEYMLCFASAESATLVETS